MTRTQRAFMSSRGHSACVRFEMCQQRDEEKKRNCICDSCARKHVKAAKEGRRCGVHNCRWCKLERKVEEERRMTLKRTCEVHWERWDGDAGRKERENRCGGCVGRRKKKKKQDACTGVAAEKGEGIRRQCELLYCHNHEAHQRCARCNAGVVCAKCGFACCYHGAHGTASAFDGGTASRVQAYENDGRPWYWPSPHPRQKEARVDGNCDCDKGTHETIVSHHSECSCSHCECCSSICA